MDKEMQIAEWRQKARDGTLTKEEMKEAIIAMREGRISASKAGVKSRTKKEAVDGDALLDDLFGDSAK